MTEPTHKLVQANSSHRFEISLLHVTSDVLGASHDFLCAGKNISIEISGQDSPHAHCVAWRTEGHIPLEYKVEQIVLRASVEGDLSVPREALDGSFNLERFSNEEAERFNGLINSHSALALDALRRWLAVLRWKTGIGSIGEPMVVLSDRSSGGAILEESATRYRFWQQGRFAVGRLFPAITAAQWQDAQTSLSKAEIPPVWFAFLFESHQRINNGDLVGASLSLAITLESIIRVLITQHLLTQKVEELILDIVDRAPIGSVLDRIRNLSFWDDQWERETDLKMFKEIMADRNRIMHSAQIGDLDEQDLRKRYLKMKSFAYFASQFLEAPPST